ncbi:hypothetical protein Q0590_34130 [Rhodocytophaga aerolata]|uniref:DUF3575 domain-containing protein n=1 Tax=Rhodocytophaga aerolata TaxID=455078 RepID=A0ABT8RGZ0_9BACT|nr:hypothetical protein [Rhodocytophaga aerolata]MDO1451364.1 hypothetical protein [Rhodocytophaga aerolata]
MQKKMVWIVLAIVLASRLPVNAQYARQDITYKRWFVGSTIFLLGNLAPTNPPNFFQLNIGYRLTGKDVITLEPKTWKYAWPNGIHPLFNKSYGKPEEEFPGYVREFGISVAYQRFFWKGLYAELNVMPSRQTFVGNDGKKISNGFQLFNTYRIGYHIKLLKDRFFIQPSLAITHRAYHSKLPDGFKQLDDKWSKFIFGEPGFHFGFNF